MMIHPFQPCDQLPCMSIVILSEEGELFVSGSPEGVSKKIRPSGGGDVNVCEP